MHSEAELVRDAQAGRLGAMESLYASHRSMVYAVALGVCGNGPDADEVLQETFLRAFRSLADWRGEGKLSTWLYSIALRTALNWRRRFFPRPIASRPPDEAPDPGDAAMEAESQAAMKKAIAQLPPQQRIVLTLRHLRGLSLAEIAELQGCARGTVKSNLHHAIARMKETLA
ncbi:MAG TPA: sigma-70 family RNA polymerase sigma factor, partial [Planctomycetota bacterium]|nr:sigma-70 family RNA polymerase sigma factor [Planctomycetota bacterium]